MKLRFTNPDLEKFIAEQVEAGNYSSPESAFEAAVEQMMHEHIDVSLTDADLEEIRQSDAEIDRGEFVEFDSFAAEMRKKYPAH
jgi:Arc/MetJ-type ribon-helix-helix transcriptional regulator